MTHQPRASFTVAAVRAAGDVHAAAARRGSARVSTSRSSACRTTAARRTAPARGSARERFAPVVADPQLQLLPEGGAVRSAERRGRRRRRRAAGEHREVLRGGGGAHRRDRRRRRAADRDRRRPFDLAAGAARARQAARPARAGAVRRAHRHLGRVLRRQVLSRHAVPARDRRGHRSTASGSSRSASAGRCTAKTTSSSIASTASR